MMKSAEVKKRIKQSRPLRWAQDYASPILKDLPIETWPGPIATLYNVRVPGNIPQLEAPTAECGSNINIILRLMKQCLSLEGNIAECGVYQAATLIPMGLYLKQNKIPRVAIGFDSFEGFDSLVNVEIQLGGTEDKQKKVGGFGDTSSERILRKVRCLGIQDQVTLVKGYFHDTLTQKKDEKFCFVHLDCDIYDSYKYCLEFFYPRLSAGGVILLDEYNDPAWPGCNKAVDEFLLEKREKLEMIEDHNHLKYFVRKLS